MLVYILIDTRVVSYAYQMRINGRIKNFYKYAVYAYAYD